MNGRNGPMSPVSVGGSEWSGFSKYNDQDPPYSPAVPNPRGQLASPPVSNTSSGTMNGGFPPRVDSGAAPGGNGNPSPPSSVARSSVGTGLYARSDAGGGGGSGRRDEQFEATLSEHYTALKRYLAQSLRDEKGNPRPNRARDKLLRLSSVQFQELSTDVFDELLRRQQSGRRAANGPMPNEPDAPPYLLPKDSFHPKRNQARQKLSTLPGSRFKDLATDVFYELERRFPHFAGGGIPRMGSPASIRRPPSRSQNGTPLNGMRDPNRMRRPSDASSIAYSMRSEPRNGPRPPNGMNSIPPSPGIPPNDYGRPTPKTFQSNTIVPNKSTMVEDESGAEDNDDDDADGDAFGLEDAARSRDSKKSSGGSETDKKLLEDYQAQVAELREKLDAMEDTLKQKDDELQKALSNQKDISAGDAEIQRLEEIKADLETKLADAENLNESLKSELEHIQFEQANTERGLRDQIEDLQRNATTSGSNPELERENEELRQELLEQQQVTEEVRMEAQESLREMRMLSERTTSSYEREEQLMAMVEKLEQEVKDWRNRYARTKTQLRGLRATSMGLQIPDAARYTKDNGFTQENGLVKDVHVTKFQISIDELLRVAREDEPSKVMDYLKVVVVNVRNITKDIDESRPQSGELAAQQAKLKSRVSATANNLTTAVRNFSSAHGLSPISLLDAAASHLTTSVVELIKTVKIRPTPAGELEDDDDGTLQPVDSTGFFPVREPAPQGGNPQPPYAGLRNGRISGDSSAYSPAGSPRQSINRPRSSGRQRGLSRASLGGMMNGSDRNGTPAPMGVGFGIRTQNSDVEELKIYLEDQTALLVQNIQALVSSIRSDAGISAISSQIDAIADVVQSVVSSAGSAMSSAGGHELKTQGDPVLKRLSDCRQRLIDAGEVGKRIAYEAEEDEEGEAAWRDWNKSLPPIAFEIARETKELVLKVDVIEGEAGRTGEDDFS